MTIVSWMKSEGGGITINMIGPSADPNFVALRGKQVYDSIDKIRVRWPKLADAIEADGRDNGEVAL